MKFKKNEKLVYLITLIMIGSCFLVIPNTVESEENEQLREIRDFDGILIFAEGDLEAGEDLEDYLMHDNFPGDWCDARNRCS